MQLTNPPPNTDSASSSGVANKLRVTILRHAWQWLTLVRATDPVRAVLNRGFAYVITTITLILILLNLATLLSSVPTITKMVILAAIPFHLLMWWLNRRGTIYGAVLAVIWFVLATALGTARTTYAGEFPVVHVLFMFSIVVATLFIRPRAGIWALALQMAALGIALSFSDVPRERVAQFLIIGSLNLGGITAFLIVGASIFSRALHASIAANAALQQLNQDLEQRVAERTTDLAAANIDGWTLLENIRADASLAATPVVICSISDPSGEHIGMLANVTACLPVLRSTPTSRRSAVRRTQLLSLHASCWPSHASSGSSHASSAQTRS